MNNKVTLNILPLDTHDAKTLGIGDISFYPQGYQVVSPSIQITPPAFKKVTLSFTAKNMTLYNSNTLGLSDTDDATLLTNLPDGIWKVKYTITPANILFVEKSFLRTDLIQSKFGQAFLYTDLKVCDSTLSKVHKEFLDEVWYYIQGAIADANKCSDKAAMDKYSVADKMLNRFIQSNC